MYFPICSAKLLDKAAVNLNMPSSDAIRTEILPALGIGFGN
jgi:hypothetical protein